MAKPPQYALTVVQNSELSPNMRRITLNGPSLAAFPPGQEGAYVKLFFPAPGQDEPEIRTYTVKGSDPQRQEMEIDFVIHADGGPGASWAKNATPGDRINIAGPGPRKVVDPTADWFLIAGDMSALPAIRANLLHLPPDAKGHLVLEVLTEADKSALDVSLDRLPSQLQLHWLINPHPGENRRVSEYLERLQWFDGAAAIWVAGELGEVLKARTHVKHRPTEKVHSRYFSSYWQFGATEDRHKAEKRRLLGS